MAMVNLYEAAQKASEAQTKPDDKEIQDGDDDAIEIFIDETEPKAQEVEDDANQDPTSVTEPEVEPEDDEDDPEGESGQSDADGRGNSGKGGRAKRRIEALARERSEQQQRAEEATRRAEEAERRAAEAEEKFQKTQSSSQAAAIKALEDTIASLKKEYATSIVNDDVQGQADLNTEIAIAAAKLATLQAAASAEPVEAETKELPTKKRQARTPQPQQLPQRAIDWAENNLWFQEPESRAERQLGIRAKHTIKELLTEGYDPNDSDFFTELEADLTAFAKEKELEVGSFYKKPKTVRQKQSPRSGGTSTNEAGKVTLKITEEDKQFAKRMGLDVKAYVRRRHEATKAGKDATVGLHSTKI